MKKNTISSMMQDNSNQIQQSFIANNLVPVEVGKSSNDQTKEESGLESYGEEIIEIKNVLAQEHRDLLQKNITDPNVKEELAVIVETLVIDKMQKYKLSEQYRQHIVTYILQSLTQYGPITDLYNTPGVTDIHIKSYNHITYRKHGKVYDSAIQFSSDDEVNELAQKLLREADENSTRKINWSRPIENGKLNDGSRFNVMVNPISLNGVTISIRKHREKFFTEQQLIENGTLSVEKTHFIMRMVQSRINILIVGGGGTGKTEIARLVGTYIPKGLNVDTIEDINELNLDKVHDLVRKFEFRRLTKEDREKGMTGTAYDIIRWGSLRSDIDIVVLGEILDDETFPILLDGMSIGQPGSFATMHADTARAALQRGVKMYASQYPNLSETFIMNHIANTIDLVITVKRYPDGKRRNSKISQINGIKNGEFDIQDIFSYSKKNGHYRTDVVINERILEKAEDNLVECDFEIGSSENKSTLIHQSITEQAILMMMQQLQQGMNQVAAVPQKIKPREEIE